MPGRLLKKVGGNKYVNHSFFRPYLYVYDDMIVYTKRRKIFFVDEATLPYNQIARVNLHKGLFFSKFEIAASGGNHDLVVKGIWNRPAKKLKKLIDDKIYHEHNKQHFKHEDEAHVMDNFNKSLSRLQELYRTDRISKKDFEKRKKELLKDIY